MRFVRIFDGVGRDALERVAEAALCELGQLGRLEALREEHPLMEDDFAPRASEEVERMRRRRVSSVPYANECGNCKLPILGASVVCACVPGPRCRDCGELLRTHGRASATGPWECPGP